MATKILPRELPSLPVEKSINRVIGSGPTFPWNFSDKGDVKSVDISFGFDKIQQSIWTILTTRKGERVGRPTFGSKLPYLLFEPNDESLWVQLEYETAGALKLWEPRIRVRRVTAIPAKDLSVFNLSKTFQSKEFVDAIRDGDVIAIAIEYEVLRTHQLNSFVFPFVLQATPISYGT